MNFPTIDTSSSANEIFTILFAHEMKIFFVIVKAPVQLNELTSHFPDSIWTDLNYASQCKSMQIILVENFSTIENNLL